MKQIVLVALAGVLSIRSLASAGGPLPVIPAPNQVALGAGGLAVGASLRVDGRGSAAAALRAGLQARGVSADGAGPVATLALGGTGRPAESYLLRVTAAGVRIEAGDEAGLFYGAQSLLWLLEAASNQLPVVAIEDAPRFGWRGFMLDESRHFFGKAVVKQWLDAMAYLKLNRFHWHLTDEPGWRIEIKKYPRLTAVGGRGSWSDAKKPAAFYTQDDIREIVAYAADRHIMVIPEIDMPGHANAATRAYPEMSAGGTGRWNGFTFNPAREETYRFLEDVLAEVAALFPGPYLHLGGDEVHYGNQSWSTDPQILAFTRAQGLTNAVGLEHYFINRMAAVVQKLGKTAIGWDEIGGAGLPTHHVAMWWRHDKPQVLGQVIAQGYPVVLTPRRPCYFDFVQHDAHQHGRRWGGFNDLDDVYDFPGSVQARLDQAAPGQVLGLQASLWTERVADPGRLGFMTFPRLAALAEAGWTQAGAKDKAGFRERLRPLLRWFDRQGIRYFNPFDPKTTPEPAGPDKADVIANG